jgi:hypothetical protein
VASARRQVVSLWSPPAVSRGRNTPRPARRVSRRLSPDFVRKGAFSRRVVSTILQPCSRSFAPTNVRIVANPWCRFSVESEGDHDMVEERPRTLRLPQRSRILGARSVGRRAPIRRIGSGCGPSRESTARAGGTSEGVSPSATRRAWRGKRSDLSRSASSCANRSDSPRREGRPRVCTG